MKSPVLTLQTLLHHGRIAFYAFPPTLPVAAVNVARTRTPHKRDRTKRTGLSGKPYAPFTLKHLRVSTTHSFPLPFPCLSPSGGVRPVARSGSKSSVATGHAPPPFAGPRISGPPKAPQMIKKREAGGPGPAGQPGAGNAAVRTGAGRRMRAAQGRLAAKGPPLWKASSAKRSPMR